MLPHELPRLKMQLVVIRGTAMDEILLLMVVLLARLDMVHAFKIGKPTECDEQAIRHQQRKQFYIAHQIFFSTPAGEMSDD